MKLTILDSVQALRSLSAEWDDLWLRSDVPMPSARAALVAQWLDHFAPGGKFRAVVVEENGRFLAALPLVGWRIKGIVEVGTLPSNDWCACGELLLDAQADQADLVARIVEGLRRLPWPLLWLRLVRRGAPRWQAFGEACGAAGLATFGHDQYEIGVVELDHDFAALEASWSGNHRRHMGKARRRLERDGGGELQVHSSPAADEIEPLLLRGFQLEERSWKGAEGTSVLATPGMFEFFCRQAQQLAAWQQLELTFLAHQGRPIAFEYGWRAKNRYFTPKVAFDPDFAQYTPSQLLRYWRFQQFAAEPSPPTVDFFGPLADATSKWVTDSYAIGSTLVALRPLVGRAMLHGYRWLRAARKSTRPQAPSASAIGGTSPQSAAATASEALADA